MFCGICNNQFMIFDIWLYGDLMLLGPDKRLVASLLDKTTTKQKQGTELLRASRVQLKKPHTSQEDISA